MPTKTENLPPPLNDDQFVMRFAPGLEYLWNGTYGLPEARTELTSTGVTHYGPAADFDLLVGRCKRVESNGVWRDKHSMAVRHARVVSPANSAVYVAISMVYVLFGGEIWVYDMDASPQLKAEDRAADIAPAPGVTDGPGQ